MNTSDMEQNSMANEVDLLALIVIARRHLRIFVATALLVTVIGITVSAFLSGQYGYSVAVQLGGFRDEKNIFNLIEDPQTVMAELQTSIIPQVLDDYGQKYPDLAKRAPQIEVKVPNGSEAVVITTEGKANQEKMIVDILDSIAGAFDDRQGVLLHQRVDTLRSLLIDTIAKSELDLTQLKKSRDAIVAKGDMTSKYLTLLLINDEISKLQNQLFILRQQLQVGLVSDVIYSHAFGTAQRSARPSGPGLAVTSLLSLLAGLFCGFLAALAVHLLDLARTRAAGGQA